VFVHADNPLRGLSLDQLRRIFTRRDGGNPIRRWGQLGLSGDWAGRPIHITGLAEPTAIGQFLLRHPLAAPGFAPDYAGRPQSREVAAALAVDPLAIGFANLNHARPGIRALALRDDHGRWSHGTARDIRAGRYPLDRHLLIYVRRGRDGRIEPVARAFLAFMLSDAGQTIIARGTKAYLPLGRGERIAERKKIVN
jgi:phosphate transport system substrate-binding protein